MATRSLTQNRAQRNVCIIGIKKLLAYSPCLITLFPYIDIPSLFDRTADCSMVQVVRQIREALASPIRGGAVQQHPIATSITDTYLGDIDHDRCSVPSSTD